MGIDVDAVTFLGVPFNGVEIVEKTIEEDRYDEFTGEKKVVKKTYTEEFYEDKYVEGFWDLREKIKKETGLDLVSEGSMGSEFKEPMYIGKYLSNLDAKCGEEPKKITMKELEKLKKEITDILKVKEEDLIISSFLNYS